MASQAWGAITGAEGTRAGSVATGTIGGGTAGFARISLS
jgi:hypothetical protein